MIERPPPDGAVVERRRWSPPQLKRLDAAHDIDAAGGTGADGEGNASS
jgi:hypothetical protein